MVKAVFAALSAASLPLADHVVLPVVHLAQEIEVPGLIPGPGPCFFVLQEGQLSVTDKSMSTLVMTDHIGGLSLPRNSVIRLTYCPNMTIGV